MTDHTEELDPFDQAYREALENAYQRIAALEAENERLIKAEFYVDFATLRRALGMYGISAPESDSELGARMESYAKKVVEAVARLPFPSPDTPQPGPDVRGLVEALHSMSCAYRSAIQAGYDRITALGGECDSVQLMLNNYPDYSKAIALVAANRQAQQGEQHDS